MIIDVVILDIDQRQPEIISWTQADWKRILGIHSSNVFPVGSYHEATIVRRDDRGAIVQLPYGLEAFAPIKHVRKEDNTLAEPDETLTFKVIEFNRDDKRILVSHQRYLEDIRREADEKVKSEKRKQRDDTRKAVKKQQSSVEKSTLGDLDVFSQLKEQLSSDGGGE